MSGSASVNPTSSTNYNPQYSRSKVITNILDPVSNTYVPEFFSINYKRLINNISSIGIGYWTDKPITTISYELFDNTTAWWMLNVINGIGHALALTESFIADIPDITILDRLDTTNNTINLNQSNVTL